eukprot:XP_014617598.1 uncharacterized protein LOC102670532 [Glycine max]
MFITYFLFSPPIVMYSKVNKTKLMDRCYRWLVDVLQWNLDGNPKKVVFTMKDKWFWLEVRVGQLNEIANFTLWDRECNALINESASEIKQQMIAQEGEFDPKDIPKAIDRILGKKLAFRFKVMPNNTRYFVSQISEDEDLIMLLSKRLPTYKVNIIYNLYGLHKYHQLKILR